MFKPKKDPLYKHYCKMEREKACCCYSWTDRAKERPNYVGLSFIYIFWYLTLLKHTFFSSKRSITVKIILWCLYRSPCRLSLWIVFFFILYLGVRKNPSNFWFREFTNGKHRWNRCCLNCVKAWILVGAAKVISPHVVTHDHGNSRVSFNVPKFCADWMLVS